MDYGEGERSFINVRELSPKSRRRYQSKLSSARLRERQRRRIATLEDNVKQLEIRIQSLQNLISFCKDRNTMLLQLDMPLLHPHTRQQDQPRQSMHTQRQQPSQPSISAFRAPAHSSRSLHQGSNCQRFDAADTQRGGGPGISVTGNTQPHNHQPTHHCQAIGAAHSPPEYINTGSDTRYSCYSHQNTATGSVSPGAFNIRYEKISKSSSHQTSPLYIQQQNVISALQGELCNLKSNALEMESLKSRLVDVLGDIRPLRYSAPPSSSRLSISFLTGEDNPEENSPDLAAQRANP